jgi:5S rRNA maturation endonuclease (ribonuclease M5)
MKTEDFERLKKLCDENGFELITESPKENDKFYVVKKTESFKATYIDWDYNDFEMEVRLAFKIPNWDKAKDKDDIGEYLAEKLEEYLNKKP